MRHFLTLIGIFIMSNAQSWDGQSIPKTCSTAVRKEFSQTVHGHTLSDPYFWLKDQSWKTVEDGVKDPEILSYIKAENAYSKNFFDDLSPIVEDYIHQRKNMIPAEEVSVPIKENKYFYYNTQKKSQNYPVYCRRFEKIDADEEVYFDQNKEAEGKKYFRLGSLNIDPQQSLLAYATDCVGNEFFTLKVRNISTGIDLEDVVLNAAPGIIWSADSSGFYYIQLNDQWKTRFLRYHFLGENQNLDIVLYEETNDLCHMEIGRTNDREYLFLQSSTKEDDAVFVLHLTSGDKTLKPIIHRQEKRHADIEHKDGFFYIRTNDTGVNFRLVKVSAKAPDEKNWQEIIPHVNSRYLTGISPYAEGIVVETRERGLDFLNLLDEKTGTLASIPMQDTSYAVSLIHTSYNDDYARFQYSSLSKQQHVMQVNLKTLQQEVLKVQDIPSGFDSSFYKTERLEIPARDGVNVPVSLVYRRDLFSKNSKNPLLLYGYGSYGYAIPPSFRDWIIPFLDKGFVYAIAHIRGGDDLGYNWYLEGKMHEKWNTFHDFIDVAEGLIDQQYTDIGKITAMGGSAGGLLMGVAVNEAPHLFNSIVAHVPFVDIMNTMMDVNLPLTKGEFVEWGNPIEDKKAFFYMLSYSPYDQVSSQSYPAMYITGGLYDPRVTYWEPLKWIAKLRHFHQGNSPLFLDMNMTAGHAGSSARDDRLLEDAKSYAFMLKMQELI